MKANFFIVGAPKCGTTAMSEYLRGSAAVFMSTPKEPTFFASDLPGLRYVDNVADYEQLFARATAAQRVIGEASPSYLYSQQAIAAIAAYNPQARILVMLRNPLDMLPSYHSQLCYSGFEDVTGLEAAWALQDERSQGRHIPPGCREPRLLQYAAVSDFAGQLERLYRHFPRERVKVILYDDLVADLPGVYRDLLAFLGLPDEQRTEFPVVNARKAARFGVVNRLLHSPPAWAKRAMARASGSRLHDLVVAVHSTLLRANERPAEKHGLSSEFRQRLRDHYAPGVEHLGELVGRDLSHWQR